MPPDRAPIALRQESDFRLPQADEPSGVRAPRARRHSTLRIRRFRVDWQLVGLAKRGSSQERPPMALPRLAGSPIHLVVKDRDHPNSRCSRHNPRVAARSRREKSARSISTTRRDSLSVRGCSPTRGTCPTSQSLLRSGPSSDRRGDERRGGTQETREESRHCRDPGNSFRLLSVFDFVARAPRNHVPSRTREHRKSV